MLSSLRNGSFHVARAMIADLLTIRAWVSWMARGIQFLCVAGPCRHVEPQHPNISQHIPTVRVRCWQRQLLLRKPDCKRLQAALSGCQKFINTSSMRGRDRDAFSGLVAEWRDSHYVWFYACKDAMHFLNVILTFCKSAATSLAHNICVSTCLAKGRRRRIISTEKMRQTLVYMCNILRTHFFLKTVDIGWYQVSCKLCKLYKYFGFGICYTHVPSRCGQGTEAASYPVWWSLCRKPIIPRGWHPEERVSLFHSVVWTWYEQSWKCQSQLYGRTTGPCKLAL